MNLLRAISDLIFGETVAFAVTSRYSLDNSIARLRGVTARVPFWPPLRTGLVGSVQPQRVRLRWHNAWIHSGPKAEFAGAFVQDGQSLALVGTIGVPVVARALVLGLLPVSLSAALIFYTEVSTQSAGPLRWLALVFPISWLLATMISVQFGRGDVQRIADALDGALS